MVYNGIITWFHRDADKYGTQPCQLKFLGKEIMVDCIDNGDFSPDTWVGREVEKGHYALRGIDSGTATLHRIDRELFLEGHCQEGCSDGYWMWKIELKALVGGKKN
jgi:hypothetical protein